MLYVNEPVHMQGNTYIYRHMPNKIALMVKYSRKSVQFF